MAASNVAAHLPLGVIGEAGDVAVKVVDPCVVGVPRKFG
jgi:hypothetical protein